jgi:hypothetical protein
MNWKFKTKLVEQYGSQLLASAKLGISPSELSLLVRGHRKPNDRQMKALRKAFGEREARELFGQSNDQLQVAG